MICVNIPSNLLLVAAVFYYWQGWTGPEAQFLSPQICHQYLLLFTYVANNNQPEVFIFKSMKNDFEITNWQFSKIDEVYLK